MPQTMPAIDPSGVFGVTLLIILGGLGGLSCVCAGELEIKEPEKAQPAEARKPERQRWSWNQAKAEITETGDIKWKPEPFAFKPGASVRYIDFDGGNDANSGETTEAPWKHHPWDAAATGKAHDGKGAITYVFKRGVVYRGELHGVESGEANNPIQLTSNPAWGKGEAVISGALPVTGWKAGATNKDIPSGDKVWYADVDYLPRNLFELKAQQFERIPLARWPHWKVSDPEDVMSEWWQFEQPEWWAGKNVVVRKEGRAHLGVDTKHLTLAPEVYKGAIVRTEFAIVMGTPFPTRVEEFDSSKKAVVFQGIWFGDSEKIVTGNRYYMEDKPQFLDAAGEFWVEQHDNGARLFLRLSGDRNPNEASIEAAKFINPIESQGMSHVHISGLSFRKTNTYWDLSQPGWGHKDVNNACVRIQGPADDIQITHCSFEQVGKAVRIAATKAEDSLDNIVIADNEMQYIDHGAIDVEGNASSNFGDIKVLRNHLFMIGMRPFRQDSGHAISVNFPVTMEVAGNVLDRCYGAGLFLFGGKGAGDRRDKPLARNLIYDNKVTSALLAANDWGEIETWQGGPSYVYNNIAGNPVGFWNWAYNAAKPGSGRLGFAYYLDGGFKNYHFNNVAWGKSNDLASKECAACAFYEATPTIQNSFFNNTVYNFKSGSSWSPAGGRHLFLGNLFLNMSSWVFMHGALKEDKEENSKLEYPYATVAYARNFFFDVAKEFALFETNSKGHADYQSFANALADKKVLSGEGGGMLKASPVLDAAMHDFRLKVGSQPVDQGSKVFVPWSLSRTVGEWQFRRNQEDPTVLLDDHWYMAPYVVLRDEYFKVPTYPLKAVNIKADDFIASPLENWTTGALKFNGKDQYAALAHAELTKPFTYGIGENKQATATGQELATPDIETSNLLIEVYFQTTPGHVSSVLVSKQAGAGYQLAINKAGTLSFSGSAGAQSFGVASVAKINDGKWHHALAELDRQAKMATIYVDGKQAGQSAVTLTNTDSLSNTGDLLVGKGPDGKFFSGAIDFLRIARGSLKDSRTTIEELYDWELDGPFLRDLAGHDATGKSRDAGAFEAIGK
jgi:hypothetical protein